MTENTYFLHVNQLQIARVKPLNYPERNRHHKWPKPAELFVEVTSQRDFLHRLEELRPEIGVLHEAIRLPEGIFGNDVHRQSCISIAKIDRLMDVS